MVDTLAFRIVNEGIMTTVVTKEYFLYVCVNFSLIRIRLIFYAWFVPISQEKIFNGRNCTSTDII